MIDRKLIEQILTANGVDPNAPDEDIKSVLISAKWHEDDVETAMMVLREDSETHKQRVDSVHKVFNAGDRLNPDTISSLLGIDVEIPQEEQVSQRSRGKLSSKDVMSIAFVSLGLSVFFVMSAMYYLQMGLFYQGY